MPTHLHEFLIDLFRRCPSLAVTLVQERDGAELPAYDEVEAVSESFTNIRPAEFRSDIVLVFYLNGEPVFVIIVEVQLRVDERKVFSWPVYQTTTRARYECPSCVLVVAPDADVADWAREPAVLGPSMRWAPLVIGPDELRIIEDADIAADPEQLAARVLPSAIANAKTKDKEFAKALVERTMDTIAAAYEVDHTEGMLYFDIITNLASRTFRRAIEDYMTDLSTLAARSAELLTNPVARKLYKIFKTEGLVQGKAEGKAEGIVEGEARGKAEGEANALRVLLESRGLTLSDAQRAQLDAATDTDLIMRWFRRALTADSADAVFDDADG